MNTDSSSRAERRRVQTRADLLVAARHVFALRGYHDASIAEITEQANVAVGTFYRHFRDKDEAFNLVLNAGFARIGEHINAAMQVSAPQLATFVHVVLEEAYAERELFRIALTGGGRPLNALGVQSTLRERVVALLLSAQEVALLPPTYHVEIVGRFITGVISQSIVWWFEHDTPGPDQQAELVLDFLRHGIPELVPPSAPLVNPLS